MKETITTTIDDVVEARIKNPFWSSFSISFIIINWHLVIYSIYEFSNVDFKFFQENIRVGWWLLIPLSIGLVNLILGKAIIEFTKALSSNIHNKATLLYIKWLNDAVIPKSRLDEEILNHTKSNKDYEKRIQDIESEHHNSQLTLRNKTESLVNERDRKIEELERILKEKDTERQRFEISIENQISKINELENKLSIITSSFEDNIKNLLNIKSNLLRKIHSNEIINEDYIDSIFKELIPDEKGSFGKRFSNLVSKSKI
ncbi:hypothetical protein QNI23_016625 [Bermanella sp. WJH001]|uniref:hypothetical protein n=1 Tax=Bermanella sp. WJH001 TaxID=3048005 RepID=UPI0024BDED23|nr:hypothetical protein [Bermanella sp. WJH001]MDJ1538931.1 hypothetical protein [Bermanella sp. WJH001]